MAESKNNVGQVIQIARGDLIKRLQAKPLAYGELFIHTGEKQNVSQYKIFDLVTNSIIKTLYEGDLFAGHNNRSEVYFLGSGGSLKWGGLLFDGTTYEKAVEKAQEFPEHLFMYNGTNTLEGPTLYYTNTARYRREAADTQYQVSDRYSPADDSSNPANRQIGLLDRSYVAEDSEEWALRINPGDVFFYSSALDQIVVLHLSRSTDALTKINVDALVSDSMQQWLAESPGVENVEEGEVREDNTKNYDNIPSTLKTFLDKPVRHYQYLVDQYGWRKTVLATTTINDGAEAGTDAYKECEIERDPITGQVTIVPGEIRIPDPVDGAIYYIPFKHKDSETGLRRYKVVQQEESDGELLEDFKNRNLHEGDLLLATPQPDGKVKFAVVSLYSSLLRKFRWRPENFERADTYATDIWREGINDRYEGDLEYNTLHDTVQDFLDRLFKTKVDIDPTTGKIISSQLPDFLLGAPKYMGHFTENDLDIANESEDEGSEDSDESKGWEGLDENTTAEQFAIRLLAKDGQISWGNLDDSEDDDTGNPSENGNNVDLSKEVNDKLKTGCYWIYQGATQDISKFPKIFHLCDDFEDYQSGAANEEDLTEKLAANEKEIKRTVNRKERIESYKSLLESILNRQTEGQSGGTKDVLITADEVATLQKESAKIVALGEDFADMAVKFEDQKYVANQATLLKEAQDLLAFYQEKFGSEEESEETEEASGEEGTEELVQSEKENKQSILDRLNTFIKNLATQKVSDEVAQQLIQDAKFLGNYRLEHTPIILSILNVASSQATVAKITTKSTELDSVKEELEQKSEELGAQIEEVHTSIKQRLLNKGDWVIFNGSLNHNHDGEDEEEESDDKSFGLFEVIDNSSSFLGILVKNTKVAGVAEFTNVTKDLSLAKAWLSNNEGRIESNLLQSSVDVDISAANSTIKFQNNDKVFAARPQVLDGSHLPKISSERTGVGNATLVNSRFEIVDDSSAATKKFITGLKVSYPTGYKDLGDAPNSALLNWHFDSADYDRTKRWRFYDTFNHVIRGETAQARDLVITTKPRIDYADGTETKIKASGLNFDWIPFMGNVLEETEFYSFAIEHEENPILALPSHSGILATENYVNQGFTVVKTIVNDVYEKLLNMLTRGHVNWLQTVRETPEIVPGTVNEKRKELYDSQILQEITDNSLILKFFYKYTPYTDTSREQQNLAHQERSKEDYALSLSSYAEFDNALANKMNATLDYSLGSTAPQEGHTSTLTQTPTETVLNPAKPSVGDPKPENVLPNHSGIVLNNNSVIDGGEW